MPGDWLQAYPPWRKAREEEREKKMAVWVTQVAKKEEDVEEREGREEFPLLDVR